MKILYLIAALIICSYSCTQEIENGDSIKPSLSIIGTWKLISGITIKDKDTLVTDYTNNQEMIKIINKSHFAFLRHDLNKGNDSSAIFVSGGGKYFLQGNKYTEHLEYCNFREWEDNNFEFEYNIVEDTLITKGIEKVEDLGVDHINIEKYIRMSE